MDNIQPKLATEKQIAFITSLLAQKIEDGNAIGRVIGHPAMPAKVGAIAALISTSNGMHAKYSIRHILDLCPDSCAAFYDYLTTRSLEKLEEKKAIMTMDTASHIIEELKSNTIVGLVNANLTLRGDSNFKCSNSLQAVNRNKTLMVKFFGEEIAALILS